MATRSGVVEGAVSDSMDSINDHKGVGHLTAPGSVGDLYRDCSIAYVFFSDLTTLYRSQAKYRVTQLASLTHISWPTSGAM
jgi:BRCT domain type II-containing protein